MRPTTLPQLPWESASTRWASILQPIVDSPISRGRLVSNVSLITGANQVNHGLGRKLIGWIIVGIDGVAAIYDTQAQNQMPQLTLNLTSDADVTVNLWCF